MMRTMYDYSVPGILKQKLVLPFTITQFSLIIVITKNCFFYTEINYC